MEELLTTKELSEFIRINEKKVYQMVKNGEVPYVKLGGKWLFPRKHLLRWIDENVQKEKTILITPIAPAINPLYMATYQG